MSRPGLGSPEMLRQLRKDPRFRTALDERVPDPSWRNRGECLRHDPEVFFPNAAEDPSPAMRVCRTCPVQGPCLAAAMDSAEIDGVWGATTPDERRRMRPAWMAAASAAMRR